MDRARCRIINSGLFTVNLARGLADSDKTYSGNLSYLPRPLTDAVFDFSTWAVSFFAAALPNPPENFMTMPSERTRSVIQTREFLIEISRNTDLPETVRRQAKQLLRHYPSQTEMLDAGQMEEHLTDGTIFQPIFSSVILDS
tara:strand:+ start:175 stop:600 length:426 start_codon:yes stop_codon:yes gene_type:complete